MVNQNVQEALMKFQVNKNKEYEKTQKLISEIIGAQNKHQTETDNTINREINELRMKTSYYVPTCNSMLDQLIPQYLNSCDILKIL
jgi:hypothetical protein